MPRRYSAFMGIMQTLIIAGFTGITTSYTTVKVLEAKMDSLSFQVRTQEERLLRIAERLSRIEAVVERKDGS